MQGRFWRKQLERERSFSSSPGCLQSRFSRYVEQILHHEGFPPIPESHSGVFIKEVATHSGRHLEDFVFPNDQYRAAGVEVHARLLPVIEAALIASDDPVDERYKVRFGCNFNYER